MSLKSNKKQCPATRRDFSNVR